MHTAANILATATATGPYLFWITSRAAGIAALLLSSVSVCVGLLMGGRLLRHRRSELRITHEALSLATLTAIVVHGLSLLGDSYVHSSLGDIAIPFLDGYKTLWTSMGIVAFWALLVLGLSYYARGRIGVQRWRMLHRFAALAWILGLVHSLGEGTDAGQAWFLASVAIVAVPALSMLAARRLSPASAAQAGATR
ncbi:MAG TPA: ferric reductase-like transmembrane domain-containing protein [Solirubrobacteraceae bacterium]|jgi:sulfoxide reductase heme-binding subunit YedZ|nr:ferric reductase-like transmembrane domain-containing protein [Solirubrobacteraceae bacterium]